MPPGSAIAKLLVLIACPLVWAGHFAAVYAAPSLEIALRGFAGWPTIIFIVVITLVCLASIGWYGWRIWKGREPHWRTPQADLVGLWRHTGALLALLSFVGVLFQSFPALLVTGDALSHDALFGGTVQSASRSQ